MNLLHLSTAYFRISLLLIGMALLPGIQQVYASGPPPVINSFSPTIGSPGTLVTISGANLGAPTSVSIGGVPAVVVSNDGVTLVAMLMPGAFLGPISVTTADGNATTSAQFTVTDTPYPSLQQGSKLSGSNAVGNASQGYSVAISADGNTAAIGGFTDNSSTGAAWVFVRNGGAWTQQDIKLVGSGATGASKQGHSVALSADGNTLAVGGPGDNSNFGAVWIFTRSGTTWTQQGSKLTGTGAVSSPEQGFSVALNADGNTLLMGAKGDNGQVGAAWVFTRSGGVWTQQGSKLVGSGSVGQSRQGWAVALSADGNTAAIGCENDNSGVGAVWIFTRSGTTWTQQGSKLTGSGAVGTSFQGTAVALSADGNTLAAGGYYDDSFKGAVWIYVRNTGVWSQQGSKLTATSMVSGLTTLGRSVALSADGNVLMAGGYGDNSTVGAAWNFTRFGTTWTEESGKRVGTGNNNRSRQGFALAMAANGKTCIVGGPTDGDPGGNFNFEHAGASWVFVQAPLAPVISLNGPTSICPGASRNLDAGAGYDAYLWSNNETTQSINVSPGAMTTYTVTVTNNVGNTGTASVTIDVYTAPSTSITAGSAPPYCSNEGVSLSAGSFSAYNWSTNAAGPSVTVNSSGLYAVTVTDANGCTASASLSVSVLPSPSVSINADGPLTFCEGGDVTLTSSTATSYAWSNAESTQGITVTESGTYTVTVTAANGCTASSSETVTVESTPELFIRDDDSICEGDETSLVFSDPEPGYTYSWSPTLGLSDPNVIDPVASPASTTTYTLTVTSPGGACTNSGSVTITVIPAPQATLSVSNGACSGSALLTLSNNPVLSEINWKLNGNTVKTYSNQLGQTVAGNGVEGDDANQLDYPMGIFVTATGDIYVADNSNHRVQKWAPGATSGVTVAGGNGDGAGANQLDYPADVFVDGNGNVYVLDSENNRVQKWAPGASSGVTVAGGNGEGSDANQFYYPSGGLFVVDDTVYVGDQNNSRVQKWAPGATSGVTVAGGNGYGGNANQLSGFYGGAIFVDASGNVYVADGDNNRIQKWARNASSGVTVAGGNGYGNASDQLAYPSSVFVDALGNLFITDAANNRIQKWAPGASSGITVAGGNGYGSNADQLDYPTDVQVSSSGVIYVADPNNERIQKFGDLPLSYAPTAAGTYSAHITDATGCSGDASPAILINPVPDANTGPSQAFCQGGIGVSIGATPVAGNTYAWDPAAGLSSATVSNPLANPAVTTVYTLTETITATGCSTVNRIRVQVQGPPGISAPLGTCLNEAILQTDSVDADAQIQWRLNGNVVSTVTATPATSGITVAGGNGGGSAASQFDWANAIHVDGDGNLYVSDTYNHRVQKWAPGATEGVTVAGGNGVGSDANQLYAPSGVFVDAGGNLYVADQSNFRVQMWAPNATSGVTVAGGNGYGSNASQLKFIQKIFVDNSGNLYIADADNHRIQKWAPNATSGVTVAGGNGSGSAADQLDYPYDVYVDPTDNVYVLDHQNHRVQKWAPAATSGVTVAGGNGQGGAANQLSYPRGLYVDAMDNLYIADSENNRIQKWAPAATSGITVAGGNGFGENDNQTPYPSDVFVDENNNIFTSTDYSKVQKWAPAVNISYKPQAAGVYTLTVTTGIGCVNTSTQSVTITESPAAFTGPNSPICFPSTTGITLGSSPVAGHTYSWSPAAGLSADNIANPVANPTTTQFYTLTETITATGCSTINSMYVYVDPGLTPTLSATGNCASADTLKISGAANAAAIQWLRNGLPYASVSRSASTEGVTVAGTGDYGSDPEQLEEPWGICLDAAGNLYVADYYNNRVQKWAPGATSGVTVAGGNGYGNDPDQFDGPRFVFVDALGNLYVSDYFNSRVQKWAPGATFGVTVAGGNGDGNAPNQLSDPEGIFVDADGNLYIADNDNDRIQKWAPGATFGITVAGGNGTGSAPNQLDDPRGIFVDAFGNLYIADEDNDRIQKWAPGATFGITVAGGNGGGGDPNQLDDPNDVYVDELGNIYVCDEDNHRVQLWAPGATSGITVAGGNGDGDNSNQLNTPEALAVSPNGDVYVSDNDNNRVQKWASFIDTTLVPSQAGNYSAVVTTRLGCDYSTTMVAFDPAPAAETGPNQLICGGGTGSVNLGTAPVTGSTYSWSPATGLSSTTVANPVANPTATQVYFLTETDIATGCSTRNSVIVRYDANVPAILSGQNDPCLPSIELSLSGADEATQILWQRNTLTVSTVNASLASSGITVAGGNGYGGNADQLTFAADVSVDADGNVYVTDFDNHRVQKWAPGATTGVTVAGGNGEGYAPDQLAGPIGVFVDIDGNVYVSDVYNSRVQKWGPGASSGVTVAGDNGYGSGANQLSDARGLFVDANGNLYVADRDNHRIQKWAPGATSGVTVAGGNGEGDNPNQLDSPTDVFVDENGNLFIADQGNNRIQKWAPGASSGTTVVQSNGYGSDPDQLEEPYAVAVDTAGFVYISDTYNNRIQKWAQGASSGVTVAGGNGYGSNSDQLAIPFGLHVDAYGNLFITDLDNQRVQKWGLQIETIFNTVGPGAYQAVVTTPNGCVSTSNPLNVAGDILPPTISDCPANVTVQTGPGSTSCDQTATWTEPTASDNCDTEPILSSNYMPGAVFSVGSTLVTYTATDESGNTSLPCSFSVVVQDNTAPVISNCPSDLTVQTGPGRSTCDQTATWTEPSVNDNCDANPSPSRSHAPGSVFTVGSTLVSYTYTDAANNTSDVCSFNVVVQDNTPPVISGCPPSSITWGTGPGSTNCETTATWTEPTVNDNCDPNPSRSRSHAPGSVFAVGSTTVSYSYTDAANNTSTLCSFNVVVQDYTPPAISGCPSNVTVQTGPGRSTCDQTASWTEPTATDNCGGTPSLNRSHTPGSLFNVGSTTVSYIFSDNNSNAATCSFVVAVQDNTPPVLSCPQSLSLDTDNGLCSAAYSIASPVSDNCPGANWSISSTGASAHSQSGIAAGSASSSYTWNKGTSVITLSASDAAGNTASSCQFSIVVSDSEQPYLNCPSSTTVSASGSLCTYEYTLPDPSSDNCPGSIWFMYVSGATTASNTSIPGGSAAPPVQLNIGTSTILLLASDAAFNSSSFCDYSITVVTPEIEVRGNGQIISDGDMTPSLSDDSDFGQTNNPNPVVRTFTIYNYGTAPLNISNISIGGLHATEFSAGALSPASPILPNGNATFTVSFQPTAVGVREAIVQIANNDCDESAYDFAISAEFTCIATTFSACPATPITVNTAFNTCAAAVNYTVTAQGTPAPTLSYAFSGQTTGSGSGTGSGSTFNKGMTTVQVTAVNPCSTAVCSFTVTVVDNQPPLISCPANITANSSPTACTATVLFAAPNGTDNCPGASTTQTAGQASGTAFPVGTTLNTFTVTAANGQSASCSFSVVVRDQTLPTLTCPANKVVCATAGGNTWIGTGLEPLSLNDNCGTPGLSHRLGNTGFLNGDANGRNFNNGATTVTYRATDANGNSASCSFTVTVRKTPNPYWSQTAISICSGASVNLASYARDNQNSAKRYEFYEGDANGNSLVFLGTVTANNGNVNFGQNRIVLPAGNSFAPVLRYYYLVGINTFANGPSCSGQLSGPLTVTVNPVPVIGAMVSPSGQICPNDLVTVTFISTIPGTLYWSNTTPSIGLAANGTGNISFTAGQAGIATITAQLSAGACGSAPVQVPLIVSDCGINKHMTEPGYDPFGGVGLPQLFPNPTSGQLFLRLPSSDAPTLYATRLEFFDAAGRRVWMQSFDLAGGAERRLDLSRLPAGVYSWTLRVGDNGYNGRVIKQ